jgi:hypothetical protein
MQVHMTEQRLAALEIRHRATLSALIAAHAAHSRFCDQTQVDELDVRRALARVQHLQGELADVQSAMELLEDDVTA